MDIMLEHLGQGLWLSLMLSMPAVLLAAGIGLLIGILQAVTQVQEQTISAAPKIMGVFLLIILGGGIMMNMLTNYVREAVYLAFNEIPQSDTYILPPRARSAGQQRAYDFYKAKLNVDDNGKARAFFNEPAPDTGASTSDTVLLNNSRSGKPQAGVAERMTFKRN